MAAMAHHPAVAGAKGAVLLPDRRQGHLDQRHAKPAVALPRRPRLCLPALSLLPGHSPAQLARWCSLGNRLMSTPISAITTSAVRVLIPGIVSRCLRGSAKGSDEAR